MNHVDYLKSLSACDKAIAFAATHPTLQAAWDACERGDWLLWLAGRSGAYGEPWSAERRPLVAAAVACARLALPIFEAKYPNNTRVRDCLDTMDRWCRGEASDDDACAATASASAAYAASASAAYAAASASASASAAYTASASAHNAASASAAYNAAYTAAYAHNAAYTAAYAYADARSDMQRRCAEAVRAILTCPLVPELAKEKP